MKAIIAFVGVSGAVLLGGTGRVGTEVVESDDPVLLGAFLNFVNDYWSSVAVRNGTLVHLPNHIEGDYACETRGEYGRGPGWNHPWETGGRAKPDDSAVVSKSKYVLIGRGCRMCIYNEMSGSIALLPSAESEKERLQNWRFLPCGELLEKLRSIGLAESSVTRFAQILALKPNGEPLPLKTEVPKRSGK